jgi:hypothetical protein
MVREAPAEDVTHESEPAPGSAPPVTRPEPSSQPASFVTACQDALFAPEEPHCDACGLVLDAADADDEGELDGGHGLYVWARNGETFYEEPPLCAACATAITITALQRWEIEEEDG